MVLEGKSLKKKHREIWLLYSFRSDISHNTVTAGASGGSPEVADVWIPNPRCVLSREI